MNQEEFLLQHLTEGKKYQQICDEHGSITLTQLREWWETGQELRAQIKRSNILFESRKGKEEFAAFQEAGKRAFFEWLREQPRHCAYCGITEDKLQKLFDNTTGSLSTKRRRGRSLELERRDSKSNEYSIKNCVLACYFCNNHKSDVITEEEHRLYFAPQIRKYLEDKYAQLKTDGNR
ncbi:hypothetical protein [Pontibacter liquoris]|uniref:hypothetical protein n=1 Tax=Pontibacter liquoris TaxID=2905677 RepID=UPI001FA6F070|nr:hypothetical protein [Pontibacter liquoris]